MEELILASASPRRRELLGLLGLAFRVETSDVDEAIAEKIAPAEVVQILAERKALAVAARCRSGLVIGADTIVVCENRILGKPCNEQDARRMVELLSGKTHQVLTGVSLVDASEPQPFSEYECTNVTFKELSETEIDGYISTGEPFDKAGAYAIQGRAAVFVKRLDGCYFNVVGLPIYRLSRMLERKGVVLWR